MRASGQGGAAAQRRERPSRQHRRGACEGSPAGRQRHWQAAQYRRARMSFTSRPEQGMRDDVGSVPRDAWARAPARSGPHQAMPRLRRAGSFHARPRPAPAAAWSSARSGTGGLGARPVCCAGRVSVTRLAAPGGLGAPTEAVCRAGTRQAPAPLSLREAHAGSHYSGREPGSSGLPAEPAPAKLLPGLARVVQVQGAT